MGWLNRSQEEARRRKRRWQMLGLLLLGVAFALYWIDRRFVGALGAGHEGGLRRPGMPEGLRQGSRGTAPAGAPPMPTDGATDAGEPGALEPRAEATSAKVTEAEPASDPTGTPATAPTQPASVAADAAEAPAPAEWEAALAGEAPDDAGEASVTADAAAAERVDSGAATQTAEAPAASGSGDVTPSIASGWVEGDGTTICPDGYPIKGNASSRIYHMPGRASYDVTKAEICFATEEDATTAGYRPPKR